MKKNKNNAKKVVGSLRSTPEDSYHDTRLQFQTKKKYFTKNTKRLEITPFKKEQHKWL